MRKLRGRPGNSHVERHEFEKKKISGRHGYLPEHLTICVILVPERRIDEVIGPVHNLRERGLGLGEGEVDVNKADN